VIALLVATALASALWIILFPVWHLLYGYPVNLREVSRQTGLVFPRSARLTRSWLQDEFLGGMLWARVEMNRSDAKRFMGAVVPNAKLTWLKASEIGEGVDSFMDLKPPDWQGWMWWKPDSVRNGVGARVDIAPGGFADLLIDGSDSAKATLYVFCWLS